MASTSVNYQCLNCQAPLTFIPGNDKVTCEYCGTEFEVATIEAMFAKKEEDAAAAQAAKEAKWDTRAAGGDWSEEEAEAMKAFTCSSCGAEIVSDGNTMATECCYCGNPTMLPSRFDGMLKPDYIIPFKKTKQEAVEALKAFYKDKPVLPDAFTANNRVEDIQGMYVPFWLFTSMIEASQNFNGTTEDVVTTDDAIITTTHHYRCERRGTMEFDRIPVDGSEKMDDEFMESIEPFDYSEMVPFSTAYLTGYLADKYDVDADAAVERADKRIETSANSCLARTVTGYHITGISDDDDDVDTGDLDSPKIRAYANAHNMTWEDVYDKVQSGELDLDNQTLPSTIIKTESSVHYAMVPVWILTTRYKDQPYTFMMNGQTGKVVGSLPIDEGKLQNKTIMTFAIVAVVLIALAQILL